MLKMKNTATTHNSIVANPISRFCELVSSDRSRFAFLTFTIRRTMFQKI